MSYYYHYYYYVYACWAERDIVVTLGQRANASHHWRPATQHLITYDHYHHQQQQQHQRDVMLVGDGWQWLWLVSLGRRGHQH